MKKCESLATAKAVGSLALAKAVEYVDKKKLHGDSAVFFRVPESLIFDSNAPPETMVAFAYLSVRSGIDGSVMLSLNHMAEWSGRKPDKHKGMVNDRMCNALSYLSGLGYARMYGTLSHASPSEGRFDRECVSRRCDEERYAVLYVDEVRKLLSSDEVPSSEKESSLLLLAYLRMMIPRRVNEFFAEESDVEDRRRRYPEAYNARYQDIAAELNVTPRSVSKMADALSSLGLIYSEPMPRQRDEDGKWHTGNTLFCNFYKREGSYLLASGKEYYASEVKRKKEKLESFRRR